MSTADRPNKEEAVAIWKESTKELYVSTSDDYLEIIIQYGFIVMFASTFPWAAVASMLWNMLELCIDAVRLVSMDRRPVAHDEYRRLARRFLRISVTRVAIRAGVLYHISATEGRVHPGAGTKLRCQQFGF